MKRNKEGKARIRLISAFYMNKENQICMDKFMKKYDLSYDDLWHGIKSVGFFAYMETISNKKKNIKGYALDWGNLVHDLYHSLTRFRVKIRNNKEVTNEQISCEM